jgi:hypothetical protein
MCHILLPQSSWGWRELRPCCNRNCHHVVLYCILLQAQWSHSFQTLGSFSMIVVSSLLQIYVWRGCTSML